MYKVVKFKKSEVSGKARGWSEGAMDDAIAAIKKLPSDDHYKKKAAQYRAKELAKRNKGKSFHQNRRDLANKGITSKPIDKNKFFGKTQKEDAGDAAVAKARHTIQQGRLKLQHARSKNTRDTNRERMASAQKDRHKAKYNAARSNEAFEQFMEIQNDE
jgi:hypothetical protein